MLILVIAGFALGLVAIASVRAVRGYLAAQRRDHGADSTSADTEGDADAQVTNWSGVAARTGAALVAVGAAAAFLLSGLAEHFVEENAQQLPKLRAIILAIAFVSALIPALRPRLTSVGLGVLLGMLTAAAIGVVTVFAIGAVNSLPAAVVVLTITAVPVAGGAALIALAVSFAVDLIAQAEAFRQLARFTLGCTIIAGLVYAGYVWHNQPPAPDTSYRLQPSTWHGEMMYGYRAYAFKLVVEKVDGTGQFVGYMDWDPEHRLKIEGKATANHLVFEDTEFLRGREETGIFDRKDVWITGNTMRGTDKNGRAKLEATLVVEPVAVEPLVAPPAANASKAVAIAIPRVDAALLARTEMLCGELAAAHEDAYAAACWSNLALLSGKHEQCAWIPDERIRYECLQSVAAAHAELAACRALGADRFALCAYTAAAAVQNDSLCSTAFANGTDAERTLCKAAASGDESRCQSALADTEQRLACHRALAGAAQARSAFQALDQHAFFETPSVVAISACDATLTPTAQTQDLCQLDKLRRGQDAQGCGALNNSSMQALCEKISRNAAR